MALGPECSIANVIMVHNYALLSNFHLLCYFSELHINATYTYFYQSFFWLDLSISYALLVSHIRA
jgi:hypothetical protein